MTVVTDRYERELLARQAWEELPHGGRDALVLDVQCHEGHQLAKVFRTGAGLVIMTTVRPHSHGQRDLPDVPHGAHEPRRYLDLLDAPDDDDAVPAWCDCGHRVLSRADIREWMAAGERRAVVE